jgi:hypothetical protein
VTEFRVRQNYPNPFNPTTTIWYEVPVATQVRIAVYDILGNEVALLLEGLRPPGRYSVEWDAGKFPSGVYFYRLQAEGFTEVKKLVLVR